MLGEVAQEGVWGEEGVAMWVGEADGICKGGGRAIPARAENIFAVANFVCVGLLVEPVKAASRVGVEEQSGKMLYLAEWEELSIEDESELEDDVASD